MSRLPERCVHLVLADLPDGRTKLRGKKLAWNTTVDLGELWSSLRRVCKPGAAMVFFASQTFASQILLSNSRSFRFDIVLRKSRPTNGINARTQPMRSHEHILVFADRPPKYFPQRTEGHSPIQGKRNPRRGDTTRLSTTVLDF